MSQSLLEEYIKEALETLTERKRKAAKPGGPRTDTGAIKQINPDKFKTMVRGMMKSNGGDVSATAKQLGVSRRTLYHYLATEPSLASVKTSSEIEKEEEKKSE